ncbi:EAL domain-containing protein [Novosphingobium cyanobacteriorum]|uniref:EAL domain-containing protein n=1 Tax=Novosphingobium cyanobacteriorum TaxID=3024215 RepID=A0ABT6CHJ0_9SPHN|nr:EAL domain-containing protein [Novosphingobium cyanobacteriorum]MDF8333396.1 EAL domain-containing protein [Novosphingobium cyanobacteriorum]
MTGQSGAQGGQTAAPRGARDYARTQRRGDRAPVDHSAGAGSAFLFGGGQNRGLIAREWPQISAPMGLGVIGVALVDRAFGDLIAPLIALVAAALAYAGRYAVRLEGKATLSTGPRMSLMALVIGLPMFLYGVGIGLWAEGGNAPWLQCLALLITVSLLATVIESGRLAGVLAAQVSMWSGVTFVASSIGGVLTLGIGSLIAAAAYMRQREIDLKEREKAEEEARIQTRAQEILADYEETGQGWFWETDRRGMLTYLSRPVAETLGRDLDDLIGRPFSDLFNLAEQSGEGERTLAFHLSARSGFTELAVRAATADEERWWSITGRPTYDTFNNFQGFRGSGTDLTEKRRSQEHASRLAHFDSLTGLSNRFRMSQTLEKILNAPQAQHRLCSVFLLDLDRFKQVNDTLGHPAGDALLKQVAQRLERCVGAQGRVGRLGGDEFQVILPGKIERDALGHLAARIIESLSQPYSIEGSRVMIGASVGIALAPDDGVTSEALIRNADLALYAAKDGGRGRYHFYAPDLRIDAEERRQLEEELRDAVANGGLELYYQPVVHTVTEKITGFEALLRWNHPVQGFVSPSKFIPIAEDTGLIATIGEWALRTACQDLAQWPTNVRVAVNVSPLQFSNPALPSIVTNALAHAQVDPARLELEITESVFLNDDEGTEQMFRALKAIGVRLALDDFGTGYSSLGYLKRAPFDKIKIDQSFVRGATQPGSRNGAIIASIVSLAEALDMETTAEGVETLDELDLVRMLGCSHVQGYIYERPLSSQNAAARLSTGLIAIAQGPRSARAARQSMLRKVSLEHGGHSYHGMIRNISQTGALVEGLWNVPPGTIFRLALAEGHVITATARWSNEDRMGVEFATPLRLDDDGRIAAVAVRGTTIAQLDTAGQRKVG